MFERQIPQSGDRAWRILVRYLGSDSWQVLPDSVEHDVHSLRARAAQLLLVPGLLPAAPIVGVELQPVVYTPGECSAGEWQPDLSPAVPETDAYPVADEG